MEDILDDIVRFYDREQRAFEQTRQSSLNAPDEYRAPPLRAAILHVLKANGQRIKQYGGANDDWFRDIRNAWKWEQEHDLAPSSFIRLDEGEIDEDKKSLKTTARVDRVLTRSIAAELGDPADVQTWAWITKTLIENEMRERQRPDHPEA